MEQINNFMQYINNFIILLVSHMFVFFEVIYEHIYVKTDRKS